MNTKAVNAYIEKLEKCREQLARLNEYFENNGEVSPDEITWSDTGEMARIYGELEEITNRIDSLGEYAD